MLSIKNLGYQKCFEGWGQTYRRTKRRGERYKDYICPGQIKQLLVFEKGYIICVMICVSLNTLNYCRALGSMRPSATGPKCTSGSNKVDFNATTLMRRTVLCNKVLLHRTVSEGCKGRSRRLGPAACRPYSVGPRRP